MRASTRSLSQLATPFFGTQAKSSITQRSNQQIYYCSHSWSRSLYMASLSFPDVQSSGRFSPSPPTFLSGVAHFDFEFWVERTFLALFRLFVLGGDPAAGSPTATLLRLNPPYKAQVRNGQHSTIPHPDLIRVVRRAVCARSRDVFTAR